MKTCFVLLLLITLQSCVLSKTNKYLSSYIKINETSEIEDLIDVGINYYPTIQTFATMDASLEEYQRLKSEGYSLIGYAMFHNEGKMSEGLAVQTGKKLGAHMVLISRERSDSGSLENQRRLDKEKFRGPEILEFLASKPQFDKGNSSLNYFHNVLFLVQHSME